MAIYSELGTGQRLYLDNQGNQTIVTLSSGGVGQQQQASSHFQTGAWTADPTVYQTPSGILVTITTATGTHSIQIQGSSASWLSETPPRGNATQLASHPVADHPADFSPQPLQPLKMGNMEMSFQPMQMKMGNMSMSMDTPNTTKRQFCSQCGTKVSESDRFCSHCGHQLA
jgi:hypothetical protein